MSKHTVRAIALTLALLFLASCSAAPRNSATSSEDGISKYRAWLADRLGDRMPRELVIATGDEAPRYGVDMNGFLDDGYFISAENGSVVILGATDRALDRAVREYAKHGNPDDYLKTYNEGFPVKKLTIAGNDISEYAVVIPDDADECVQFSASELASYIARTCGTELSTYAESEYDAAELEPAHRIVFTSGDEALGDEGYAISVDDAGDLHIDGGVWRGCMYGVYDLLEDDLGWRFVSYDYIPDSRSERPYAADHIDLTPSINRTEIPAIPIRGGVGDVINRNDNNTIGVAKYGGWGFALRSCHGLADNHDLIFSGEYAGLYHGFAMDGLQPCFTNEDIIEAIEHYADEYVSSRLTLGQTIGKEIHCVDIAQWDTPAQAFCKCQKCTKVFREEGSNAGAYLRMANRVCAMLDEHYRDEDHRVYCSCLAYCGTDVCPKITKPADNLYVAFCFYVGEGYNACSNHCISGEDCNDSGVTNKIPAARFEDWLKITDPKMIQIWYYPLNAYNICYNAPVHTKILKDIQYLVSKGIGNFHLCTGWVSNGNVNDMLSRYLASHFAWDASYTEEEALELMREWFERVYGEAGDLLYELTMLNERAGDCAGCWCSFSDLTNDRVDYDFIAKYGDQILDTCKKCVELADDSETEALIERYTAGFLYLVLVSRYDDMYVNGTQAERAAITEEYREVWERFRKYNLATYTDLSNYGHVPETFDPDVDPRLWMEYDFQDFS